MAQVIINKGFLSQGGRLYKAGAIVTIADNGYAKRIVARSGGDFDFYHGEEIPAVGEDEAPTMGADTNPAADGVEEDGAGDAAASPLGGNVSESDNGGMGLPAIDADVAVQTAKKGKK